MHQFLLQWQWPMKDTLLSASQFIIEMSQPNTQSREELHGKSNILLHILKIGARKCEKWTISIYHEYKRGQTHFYVES